MNFKHVYLFYLFWCFLELFIGKFIPSIKNEHAQDYSCPWTTFAFCSHGKRLPQQGALGPVHMIPGQLIAPGQLTDPGVNFASVHGLTSATVHISFSLPWGNFGRRVSRCTTPPCRGNFSPCEQNAKVAPGQE